MGQGHLALLFTGCAYGKVINEFASNKLVPSSFSNQFLKQNTLVIYFLNVAQKKVN